MRTVTNRRKQQFECTISFSTFMNWTSLDNMRTVEIGKSLKDKKKRNVEVLETPADQEGDLTRRNRGLQHVVSGGSVLPRRLAARRDSDEESGPHRVAHERRTNTEAKKQEKTTIE
jgi:hypothetical protein